MARSAASPRRQGVEFSQAVSILRGDAFRNTELDNLLVNPFRPASHSVIDFRPEGFRCKHHSLPALDRNGHEFQVFLQLM
jgi:hypothetical protein